MSPPDALFALVLLVVCFGAFCGPDVDPPNDAS